MAISNCWRESPFVGKWVASPTKTSLGDETVHHEGGKKLGSVPWPAHWQLGWLVLGNASRHGRGNPLVLFGCKGGKRIAPNQEHQMSLARRARSDVAGIAEWWSREQLVNQPNNKDQQNTTHVQNKQKLITKWRLCLATQRPRPGSSFFPALFTDSEASCFHQNHLILDVRATEQVK